jgi:hypothetical protein
MRTVELTDMTKVRVAFRYFAEAPKNQGRRLKECGDYFNRQELLFIKTNKCTNMYCIILKHTLKHLKSSYMFRSMIIIREHM